MKNKGFSIIEAILSCVILGVITVALINFFPISSAMSARANRIAEASILAENLIEYFRSTPFDTLKAFISVGNDSGSHTTGGVSGGWCFTREWILTDNGNLIQVEVNCYWPNPGGLGNSNISVVTQVSNHE